MSNAKNRKSHVSTQSNHKQSTNVNLRATRAKSVDSARLSQDQKHEKLVAHVNPKSLEETGYHFNEHRKLVRIDTGQPFEFFVYPNMEDNQRRYHAIGRLVDQYVYQLLEKTLKLRRLHIPNNPKPSEPVGFFYASEHALHTKYLMIIIHGMGVVRAGQWSRRLIIDESLTVGSQFEYINRAQQLGYGVVVTNTNLNIDESSTTSLNSPRRIRGSGSAEEHGCYVWEQFIRSCKAPHICIMAHSYGGAVMLQLANKYTAEFDKLVFAVALTDSPMRIYAKDSNPSVLKMLQKKTINWVADTNMVNTLVTTKDYGEIRSAGHHLHEWTSHTAFQAVFQFFEQKRDQIEKSKR